MVIAPWKALLFIAGGTAAAAVAGYVTGAFDGVFSESPPVVAALPEGTAPVREGAIPAAPQVPLPDADTPAEPAAGETARPPADTEVTPPTFDVLRVEKNGSVVIAGKSAPEADVEIINGSAVIAKTVSTADGDFAVVLDDPLKPGDYQIVLRATTPSNIAATSLETALVSVPDSPDGEVLALVEEPGKPSKLITVPEGEAKKDPAADTEMVAQPDPPASEEVAVLDEPAATEPVAQTRPDTSAAATDTAAETDAPAREDVAVLPEPIAPVDTAQPKTDNDVSKPAIAASDDEKAAPSAGPETVLDETAPAVAAADDGDERSGAEGDAPVEMVDQSQTAPALPETDVPTVAETSTPADIAAAPETPAPADAPAIADTPAAAKEEQVALATPSEPAIDDPVRPAPKAVPEPSGNQPKVRVEAVEIEGRKVFVAGQATPGMVVRVYANEVLLGETVSSPGGRFLIETERDMAVGDYIIRADLLDDGGRKVVSRAAVPFQREEGEVIAAVAPPEPKIPVVTEPAMSRQPAEDTSMAAAAPEPSDIPEKARQASDTAKAEPESADMPKAAPRAAVDAETPLSPEGQELRDSAGTEKAAIGEPSVPETQAPDTGTSGRASEGATKTKAQDVAAETQDADGSPAQPSTEMAAAQPGAAEVPDMAEEITAPKLQSVQGAVIIRRGDTLWRISRRVYGRGVRYSTIYTANQDQIADPDLIWPGQVFRVPDRTSQGETADLEAMGEQVRTVEEDPAAVQ